MSDATLELRGIGVRLGGARILEGASLAVAAGEVVALVGPNGSGKTTLLRAAMGFLKLDAGDVLWSGDAAIVLRPTELARQAAYLPQSPTLVPQQRVREAILLGRFAARGAAFVDSPADRDAVVAAAETTNVADLLERRLGDLSGGQRQRVMLARCLAQGAPTLVLDEPTTFLDLGHQIELSRLLVSLARAGRSVLMTSHDLGLAAMYADRVAVLHAGRIVAAGAPADVLTESLIADVFGVTVRRVDVDGKPRLIAVG